MKKVLSVLLTMAVVSTMTACGGGAGAASGQEAAAPAAAAEGASSGTDYQDYEASDRFVASKDAAKYEGSEEWPEITWNFDCSTGDTSTWAQAGYYFNALMQESTGGKVKVAVYAGEQLTNGDQVAGIQALMDGNTIQVSLH